MIVKAVNKISFLGNFYTNVQTEEENLFVVGTSIIPGMNHPNNAFREVSTEEIYLYRFSGRLRESRSVIIKDSYALDASFYLFNICKKICSMLKSNAYIVSVRCTEDGHMLSVIDIFTKKQAEILKVSRGSYSIPVDSQYDIKWKEFSDIKENIDLLEHMVSFGKEYSEIQYAVLGNSIIGFGVWSK